MGRNLLKFYNFYDVIFNLSSDVLQHLEKRKVSLFRDESS